MDLIDEQHVMRFEVGQQCGKVTSTFQHRPRSVADIDPHFARDDLRQRGLAQPRRAEQQHVIERLAALLRGMDEYLQLPAYLFLSDIFVELLGAQCTLQGLFLRRGRHGRDDARCGKVVVLDHALDNNLSACRMPSDTPVSLGSCCAAQAASFSL